MDRQLHMRLGSSPSPMSLQQQIKNNLQCPTTPPLSNLQPALIITTTSPIESIVETPSPIENMMPEMQEQVEQNDVNGLNETTESEPITTIQPNACDVETPTLESPLTFEEELEMLLKKHFPLKSQCLDETAGVTPTLIRLPEISNAC